MLPISPLICLHLLTNLILILYPHICLLCSRLTPPPLLCCTRTAPLLLNWLLLPLHPTMPTFIVLLLLPHSLKYPQVLLFLVFLLSLQLLHLPTIRNQLLNLLSQRLKSSTIFRDKQGQSIFTWVWFVVLQAKSQKWGKCSGIVQVRGRG